MHVAHFVHRAPPAVGGAESYFARLGHYLAAAGDEVTVWTTTAVDLEAMWRSGGVEEWRSGGVKNSAASAFSPPLLHSSTPPPLKVRRYRPLHFPGRRYALKALSLIPSAPLQALTLPCNPICPGMWRDAGRYPFRVDAVHATAFPYTFPIACGLRLARRHAVPFLLTPFLHLGDPADPRDRTRRQYTRRPMRWLLRQADRVFVQTPSERDAVVGLGVPAGRVVLQGLGVEPSECTGGNRIRARAAWGVRPGEVVVGHLANMSAEKGTIDLLRAADRLWDAGARFRVVLAGPAMPNFTRYWPTFARPEWVNRPGVLSDEQKRDFFAGIDLFALPSRTDSFGLVLLEAWANAVPVLCYRAGGPADIVRDGTDGFLVPCGDVNALAGRLHLLVDDIQLRAGLGAAGRDRTGPEFRWADKLALVRREMHQVTGVGFVTPKG